MARPVGFNDIIAQRVVEVIRKGNSRTCAAAVVGVSRATLHAWLVKYPEFLDRVRKADAEAEEHVVDALYQLAIGGKGERPHFEALKFWLKTRRAKTWREMQAAQPAEKPAQDLTAASEAELWAAVDKLRKKSA